MDVLHFYLIAIDVVSAQIVMTRLYGWKGLASTTAVLVFLIPGGQAMLIAWANGRFEIAPPPRALAELANVFLFFGQLSFLVPLFIVLVAFLLLALTVKTEQS